MNTHHGTTHVPRQIVGIAERAVRRIVLLFSGWDESGGVVLRNDRLLQETQVRSVDEAGELERAQEMRIDEFSRNELRGSHATYNTGTHFTIAGTTSSFDSQEFPDTESICTGLYLTFPSQSAVVTQVLDLFCAATKACHLIH